jgi:hypothetical protein
MIQIFGGSFLDHTISTLSIFYPEICHKFVKHTTKLNRKFAESFLICQLMMTLQSSISYLLVLIRRKNTEINMQLMVLQWVKNSYLLYPNPWHSNEESY